MRAMTNMRETLDSWRPFHWLEEDEVTCDNEDHGCDQTEGQRPEL